MIAWPAPQVPDLPGTGPGVQLHDTSTGELKPSVAGSGSGEAAGLYVCGITPYDATHMGHAATYVAFDLLVRAWRDGGQRVRYVQNVTDVDDPLLERARATGEDWRALAERETALYAEDMAALRVLPPDVFLTASETVPQVVEAVTRLVEMGAAYRLAGAGGEPDGDVYFRVAADPRFGGVSNLSRGQMLSLYPDRGGDPDRAGKEARLDALLWRTARDGEPSWDGGPLGPGRPGWHVECTAIALEHLGMGFDVQGGGSDLAFPHHEMGASHAQVLTAAWPFARCYAHAGMVGLDGEKMSKSKGNLVLVSSERAAGVEPAAIRLGILDHHYRDDWSWSAGVLDRARERLGRWHEAVSRAGGPDAGPVLRRVRERLADDLDAPAALAAVDRWASAALARGADGRGADTDDADAGAPGTVRDVVEALLGVRL